MGSFIFILVCFGLGVLFKKLRIFPENAAHVLNRFVIYVSLPALTLKQMHSMEFQSSQLLMISMPWCLVLLGFVFFNLAQKHFHFPRKSLGSLILTGSLGNTSFVGFPLLEAFYGASALSLGVLIDQPGTFLAAGTVGIFLACLYSGQKPSVRSIFKRVFTFPPFLAILFSLILRPIPFSNDLNTMLDRLASTLIPLALIAIGLQLRLNKDELRREGKALMVGLGFKLVIAPILFLVAYRYLFGLQGRDIQILLLESAMAPMITSGIIASEYGLDAELASLMVGLGIPLSLITVPLWYNILAQLL